MIKRVLTLVLGIAALVMGGYGIWDSYRGNTSPFDVVDVPATELDDNANFLPIIQPQNVPAAHKAPAVVLPDDGMLNRAVETKFKQASEIEMPTYIPERLVIQRIRLDAPIIPVDRKAIDYKNQTYDQWLVPGNGAVGWHSTSALLGQNGNVVLNGHHNAYGKVFKDLVQLEPGDIIQVQGGDKVFEYFVGTKMLLPERNQPVDVRLENARWVLPSDDKRLTLVTCWPADGNSHRLVVVAFLLSVKDSMSLIETKASEDNAVPATPSPAPTSTPFRGLKLTAICPSQEGYYSWQVENPNPYDLGFEYIVDSGYSGLGKVPAGSVTEIQTPASEGKILLLYSNGILRASRSARAQCK